MTKKITPKPRPTVDRSHDIRVLRQLQALGVHRIAKESKLTPFEVDEVFQAVARAMVRCIVDDGIFYLPYVGFVRLAIQANPLPDREGQPALHYYLGVDAKLRKALNDQVVVMVEDGKYVQQRRYRDATVNVPEVPEPGPDQEDR